MLLLSFCYHAPVGEAEADGREDLEGEDHHDSDAQARLSLILYAAAVWLRAGCCRLLLLLLLPIACCCLALLP